MSQNPPRSCVSPKGRFVYGVHKPAFSVDNLRKYDYIARLGMLPDNTPVGNDANFPSQETVREPEADTIFEISNPFAFRGTTYIAKSWADRKARRPELIFLEPPEEISFSKTVDQWQNTRDGVRKEAGSLLEMLPDPLLLCLAVTSSDPEDLVRLAELSCEIIHDTKTGLPAGLRFEKDDTGKPRPVIFKENLFEAVANNAHLPDDYKKAMVLFPGVQGNSEIVGESDTHGTHVFEYLRRNSYIPWGHYAANMAHDRIRYHLSDLKMADMSGMRHLYYQRTYVRLARDLGLRLQTNEKEMSVESLEALRNRILDKLRGESPPQKPPFTCSLWGWNFGFDFSPTGYRLHASHQQTHQQFAMIPQSVFSPDAPGRSLPAFASGDMIAEFIEDYENRTGAKFFERYIQAIKNNRRMDGKKEPCSLIVHEDEYVILFIPKAQTSQWEMQLMTLEKVGNILEADSRVRKSLDRAMLKAVKILSAMGARMITTIEYAKRIDGHSGDQRLLYAFLPKIPQSPGAFSEAQLRWINGHYPEDFAAACRARLERK